jgi:hypothetical protein
VREKNGKRTKRPRTKQFEKKFGTLHSGTKSPVDHTSRPSYFYNFIFYNCFSLMYISMYSRCIFNKECRVEVM